jgi:peptide-methionine (S)-S-oxide reductase
MWFTSRSKLELPTPETAHARPKRRVARTRRLWRAPDSGPITTQITPAGEFYPAEDYHQQYLAKVRCGYCGIGGTGVSCPVGVAAFEDAAS